MKWLKTGTAVLLAMALVGCAAKMIVPVTVDGHTVVEGTTGLDGKSHVEL